MRYALYAMPDTGHPLWQAATAWLGRDAASGARVAVAPIEGVTGEAQAALLADPARYGFHATLKAPFRLAESASEAGLRDAFESFARASAPILIPELVIRRLGRFFAFVPNEPVDALDRWAGAVVEYFEPFRGPLSESEIARRRSSGLTLAEDAYLVQWGYPYVFDAFRFHMSLTGKVQREDFDAVQAALRSHFSEFDARPFRIERLALFVEPAPGEPFSLLVSAPLGGS